MKSLQLLAGTVLTSAALGQAVPDTFQRITSTVAPGASYDMGVAGADGSFSISRAGAAQRLIIDGAGNVTVLNNLTVSGMFSAGNFSGGTLTGGATGLTLNAGGTNQNLTLSATGTGGVVVASSSLRGGTVTAPFEIRQTVDNTHGIWIRGTVNSAGSAFPGDAMSFREYGSATTGFHFWSGGNTQTERLRITNGYVSVLSTPLLIGTDMLGLNGRLQLVSDTLATGGIGFGADTNLYRSAADTLKTDDSLIVGATTASTSVSTGALRVAGGAGVAGNITVGADAVVSGNLYVNGTLQVTTGQVQAATQTDAISITSTLDATGANTGALRVAGGASILKNFYVGQTLTAANDVKVGGQSVWHAGNFNPSNYLQQSGGTVDGGTSGLRLNAGGVNQNIVLAGNGTGRVEVRDTFAITNTVGAQFLLMGNQDAGGLNKPAVLRAVDGNFYFGRGNSWTGQGGAFTPNVALINDGKVGIGTLTPGAQLTVKGSGTGTGVTLHATNSANTATFTVLDNGNVGVSTAVPVEKLQVSNGNIAQSASGTYGDLNGQWIAVGTKDYTGYPLNLGTNKYGIGMVWDSDAIFLGLSNEGANRKDAIIGWGDDTTDSLRFLSYGAEKLRITGNGNVGIGITSPGGVLEVALPESVNPAGLRASRLGAPSQYIQFDTFDGSTERIYATGSGKALRMSITAPGPDLARLPMEWS